MKRHFSILILLCAPFAVPMATAAPEVVPGGERYGFGRSIALADDTMVVGHSEGVVVFDRTDAGWQQAQTLAAAESVQGDAFGQALALNGNTLVVGAPGEGSATSPLAGAAYVFRRSGGAWTQTARLTADDAGLRSRFGASVAIDGNSIVIGAPRADSTIYADSGAMYVFEYDPARREWVRAARFEAEQHLALSGFGAGVDVSGNRAAATLPAGSGAEKGKVLLFAKQGGVWLHDATLEPYECGCVTPVGGEVALEGDHVAFSAPREYVDGDKVQEGRVYVFEHNGIDWAPAAILKPVSPVYEARLGMRLAMHGDVIAVAPRAPSGDTYLYRRDAVGNWRAAGGFQEVTYPFGPDARALSARWVAVGDAGGRDTYVYVHDLVAKLAYADPDAAHVDDGNNDSDNDRLADGNGANESTNGEPGTAVAQNVPGGGAGNGSGTGGSERMSETQAGGGAAGALFVLLLSCLGGRRLRQGAAAVFAVVVAAALVPLAAWAAEPQLLVPSDPSRFQGFGSAAATEGDVLVVGAPGNHGTEARGSAYVFVRDGGLWTEVARIAPPDAETGTRFGSSVAINGDLIVVGEPGDSLNGLPATGAFHVYRRGDTASQWSHIARLDADDVRHSAYLGALIAVDGDVIMAGGLRGGSAEHYPDGAVYVFESDAARGDWRQTAKIESPDQYWPRVLGGSGDVSNAWLAVAAAGTDDILVYRRGASGWTHAATLEPRVNGFAGADTGQYIRIDGSTLAIAAPGSHDPDDPADAHGRVHIYTYSSGAWQETDVLEGPDGARLGRSLLLANGVLVSEEGGFNNVIHLFRNDNGWAHAASLLPPDPSATALALSTDTFVVRGTRSVLVYDLADLLP